METLQNKKPKIILSIETSCDDTGVALIEAKNEKINVLAETISSQIAIHQEYGGVVPNLAAREHLKNLPICLKKVFNPAKDTLPDLIAVTVGPGLIPALLVGVSFAKALAYSLNLPIIGVNHVEAHIYANWLSDNTQHTQFPILCLIVSGGHTNLVLMKDYGKFEHIGQTLDDAAGEAFDKVAKILNLGYPGGPAISKLAEKGDPKAFDFPRPIINSKDFNFSFSGLKTAVLYTVKKFQVSSFKFQEDVCASFQQATIDVLIKKTIAAAKKYNAKTVLLAGGVAANKELRHQLGEAVEKELPKTAYRVPEIKYCTDNATAIAAAAYLSISKGGKKPVSWKKIKAEANLAF